MIRNLLAGRTLLVLREEIHAVLTFFLWAFHLGRVESPLELSAIVILIVVLRCYL
ncbi:hypothetical protein OL548_24825 [Lysinibacillus sp. MHQ-1]|nr:hypothetical protein OL548_24825 [Lysinibacillus sp. MHQ-1]